jgi:type IV pilus assembly protein PilM
MAANQAVWGIEIGQCALKAIRLATNPDSKKIEALAFDYIEHPKILSQPDADPDALSREALQTFLSRNPVKGDRVVIGVPGQSGLARFIKLPPVETSRIPEIVKYEARQQIPFALEEVVWSYQKVGKAEEAEGFALETEVGLFAMKRDLIYRYMQPFRDAGIEVDVVQMRPLAVFNFGAYDWLTQLHTNQSADKEADEKAHGYKREELVEGAESAASGRDESEFVVLLDMGADNSDLVITNGTRIWLRNLPIGGNHFTRALTKELKLTFAKAEHLKRNATKAQDPKAIFQAMRPVFNDLVSEIQRSMGYFASVHRQSKIVRFLGTGNGFKLPGLQKFLAQNLQHEVDKVEAFTQLKGDQVLTAPAFQENILSFSIVYGLALQGLGVSGVLTSLLPPEIEQARMIRRKKPWVLTAAAILLAGFTFPFFGNWWQLNAVSAKEYDPALQKADSALGNQTTKRTAFEKAKGEWSQIKSNGQTLTGNVEKRLEWLDVLLAINGALPKTPDNADRTKLTELVEVQIEEVTAAYHPDVKAWYDKVIREQWPALTVLPLDKNEPPSGDGWVFTVRGYHFHNGGQIYTMEALLDTPTGFHFSPEVRNAGIKGAVLSLNYTKKWVPGSERKKAGGGSRDGGGGGGNETDEGGGGIARGGGGGMGMGMGGGMGMSGGPGGASEGAAMGNRGMGVGGGGNDAGLDGGGDEPPVEEDTSAQVSGLDRTDFELEFVWKGLDKAQKQTPQQWFDAIQKHGPRTGKPTDALLKMKPPERPEKEKDATKDDEKAKDTEAPGSQPGAGANGQNTPASPPAGAGTVPGAPMPPAK